MSWSKKKPKAPEEKPPRFRITERVTRGGTASYSVEEIGRVPRHGYMWVAEYNTLKAAQSYINDAIAREIVSTEVVGYYGKSS